MPPIVEARNLKKTFGAFTAVKDVSFQVLTDIRKRIFRFFADGHSSMPAALKEQLKTKGTVPILPPPRTDRPNLRYQQKTNHKCG
jgi:ABC-type branched-subunit amino acid transport system ATPase component